MQRTDHTQQNDRLFLSFQYIQMVAIYHVLIGRIEGVRSTRKTYLVITLECSV